MRICFPLSHSTTWGLSLLLLALLLPNKSDAQEVVFFDDFSGDTLDRSKWNVVISGFWVNNEQQAYVDTEETIYFAHVEGAKNGALVLHPRYQPGFETKEGRRFDFTSGRINTRNKFDVTYGKLEARIKLPAAEGVWPAWWVLGNGRWPDTGEIDIMEYVGEPDWTGVAAHGPGYSGETPIVNKFFFQAPEDVTSWHVYAMEWTADALVFLVDDRIAYRATRPMIEHYGEWRFDTPKYLILNFALGGAYPFKTNGIDTPYHGLPEATVARIKKGEIAMYVDWVRVTTNIDRP